MSEFLSVRIAYRFGRLYRVTITTFLYDITSSTIIMIKLATRLLDFD